MIPLHSTFELENTAKLWCATRTRTAFDSYSVSRRYPWADNSGRVRFCNVALSKVRNECHPCRCSPEVVKTVNFGDDHDVQ